MELNVLFRMLIFSALGLGYLFYGIRRQGFFFQVSGLVLMIYPYLGKSVLAGSVTVNGNIVIGLFLLAIPFVARLMKR